MKKSTAELVQIAQAGGSLRLDAASKATSEIATIVKALDKGAWLYLRNSDSKSTAELIQIARAGSNNVVFE